MGHTYTQCFVHFVFSTKERRNLIVESIRERLWEFIGGIARKNGMMAITIGGTGNHVHVLIALPATMDIAKAAQLLKGGSSKFVHETFPEVTGFAWQQGYGGFSVSASQRDKVVEYIRAQEEHHRELTFEEEFIAVLRKHDIEFDPKYVWG
ncbi:MAG TPA: IS200/IS605 family transposase [Candidatus Hydrogenedentes bacterium]|nr:IS200/IS605 family transposase [Candidatus Hydrogenedentota bacterium]HOS01694.1 IS200/IS605 family transposase [Candidatus Hydrogenedentota bacterium]